MEDFFAAVGTALGSLGVAGITGPIGVIIGTFTQWSKQVRKRKQQELELATLQEQNRHTEAMADKEREGKLVEAQTRTAVAKESTRQASYDLPVTSADNWRWVNAIRSLFRPFITLYCGVMVWLDNNDQFWQGSFGLCLGWWFGERGVALVAEKHV